MQYYRYEHIRKDTRDLQDGEIFTVYRKDNGTWAFGMKIRGKFTLSRFQDQNVDKRGVEQAKKQILFCKKYGWSSLGKKAMNMDSFDFEHEFICMFCDRQTFDTSSPCICRNTTIEDMIRKTPSGFILPY